MGNRVLGSALKPALQVAAAKQVAAGGKEVKSAQVTFVGKQAYAVWDQQWDNGNRNNRAFRINYPALADDALLSRVEADLISAYTLHETGHVLYTCNSDVGIERLCRAKGVSREIAHPISNGLEDGRMENAVINAGVARNARYLFGRLLNKITADMQPGWNPCDFVHSAFACAMLARQAYGNGNSTTAGLLARIPEPKRSLYAWVMEQCLLAPTGYDDKLWAYTTAVEFVLRWRAIEGSKPKPPPDEPDEEGDEGDDGEPGDEPGDEEGDMPGQPGDGRGKPGKGKEDDEEDDLNGDEHDDSLEDREFDDEARDEEVDEGDDEGGSGGPRGPWEDDPEEGDEEGDEGDEDGDDGEDSDDEGDQEGGGGGDEDSDDDSETDDPNGGESDSGGNGTFNFDDLDSTGGTPKSAEPTVDEIFKRANKRAEGSAKGTLGAIEPARFEDPMNFIKERMGAVLNDKPYQGYQP